MNSLFLGAYTRYRIYEGSGELDSEKIDLTLQSFSIGLNAGKRWAWDNGLNIVFSLGWGLDINNSETNSDNGSFDYIVEQFKQEYEFMSPFYGELSIGYAF